MVLIVRYMLLAALGIGSILALANAMSTVGMEFLSEAGLSEEQRENAVMAILCCIAITGIWSLIHSAVKEVPPMISKWYDRHKDRVSTMALGFLVCLVFVLA